MTIHNDKSSEEVLNTEKQLDTLYQAELENISASPERIKDVVKSAKHEVGMRDLLTHALLRIWMPILSIGSIFFVFFNSKTKTKN